MPSSRLVFPLAFALAAVAFVPLEDATSETKEQIELRKAIARGEELVGQVWSAGAKTCMTCHARGPNKLTGRRVASYPKYDRSQQKFVSVQQKINQMIAEKSKGAPLELGNYDLNAIEAYLKTLR